MTRVRPQTLLFLLFLACVAALATLKVADPDAWLHLSCGRQIWQAKTYFMNEPFIPSMAGKPFWYSSWLFGLLYYGAWSALGTVGMLIVKILTVMAIFLVLYRDSMIPYRRTGLALIVLIFVAVIIRPRFVERPDTFLMIFLPFSIMALRAYLVEGNKRFLYVLPLVHLLWGNTHSSINLMFVPFGAAMVGGGVALLLEKRGIPSVPRPAVTQFKVMGMVLAASFLLALASPYGISQFTVSSQFLTIDVFKQEILELQPTTWSSVWWFFPLAGFTLVSFGATFRRFSPMDLLLVIPFVYLGVISNRFTFIFAVVAAPIIVRNLGAAGELLSPRLTDWWRRIQVRAATPLLILWMVGFTAIALAEVPGFDIAPDEAGFGFSSKDQPEGALAYLERRQIGGTVFNHFSWGQYITWRDFPRLRPFVDGRGYIAPNLMEQVLMPTRLEPLAYAFGINIYLTKYPKLPGTLTDYERDYASPDPAWALVYWDDLSLVYLRRGRGLDAIIAQDEYRYVLPANRLKGIGEVVTNPAKRAGILAELDRNIRETNSSRGNYLAGLAALAIGDIQSARGHLARVTSKKLRPAALLNMGVSWERSGDKEWAREYYRRSLDLRETSEAHQMLGLLLLAQGDAAAAADHLSRALELQPSLQEVYPPLITAWEKLGKKDKAQAAVAELESMKKRVQAEAHFKAGVKAYMAADLPVAKKAFLDAIAASPDHAMSHVNLGYVLADQGWNKEALAAMQRGLALDEHNSLAHYGVGMVSLRLGDSETTRRHWQRYLELEPTGNYARQIKEALASLGK